MTTFDFWTQCQKCELPSKGRLHFDAVMKVTDSDGGILFADGWTCHNCLGEPWSSGDATAMAWNK